MTPQETAAAFDAAKAHIEKIKPKIKGLPEADQQAVGDCVGVLREFLKQSGDHGVLALSVVYWELVAASTTIARLRQSADEDPSNA